MKIGTVALILRYSTPVSSPNELTQNQPELLDTLSDENEIQHFQRWLLEGDGDPQKNLEDLRASNEREEEIFADYIESLLCKVHVKPEIRNHGLQWFKSRVRVEEFKRREQEAANVISSFAMSIFCENPSNRDFLLAGGRGKVRVRIFVINEHETSQRRNYDSERTRRAS